MLRKIPVLGGGNGAHAMAADLMLKGLEINICKGLNLRKASAQPLSSKRYA